MNSRIFYLVLATLAAVGAGVMGWMVFHRPPASGAAPTRVDLTGTLSYVVGDPSASLEVVDVSDYQCPDCARYEKEEMPAIRERFINTGKLRWRYLLIALPNHPEAVPASHAMGCAMEQGPIPAARMHGSLFETQESWAHNPEHLVHFRVLAERAGVDLAAWDACMQSRRFAGAIAQGWRAAQRAGVPGTPTVLVFDRYYVNGMTANQFERLLNAPPPPVR
jgi:protein-disulfide isomerase